MTAPTVRFVSLHELLRATHYYPGDAVFRWFQVTRPDNTAGDTLGVTFGEVRRVASEADRRKHNV